MAIVTLGKRNKEKQEWRCVLDSPHRLSQDCGGILWEEDVTGKLLIGWVFGNQPEIPTKKTKTWSFRNPGYNTVPERV